MVSYWAYILIGDNDTGKTSFQKYLVADLCNRQYERLPRNLLTYITHPRMPRGVAKLSTMSFNSLGGVARKEHGFSSGRASSNRCAGMYL